MLASASLMAEGLDPLSLTASMIVASKTRPPELSPGGSLAPQALTMMLTSHPQSSLQAKLACAALRPAGTALPPNISAVCRRAASRTSPMLATSLGVQHSHEHGQRTQDVMADLTGPHQGYEMQLQIISSNKNWQSRRNCSGHRWPLLMATIMSSKQNKLKSSHGCIQWWNTAGGNGCIAAAVCFGFVIRPPAWTAQGTAAHNAVSACVAASSMQ